MDEPSDDLTCHFVSRVCNVSCETKVGELELPIRGDKQVIGFQILQLSGARISNATLYTGYRVSLRKMIKRLNAPGGE